MEKFSPLYRIDIFPALYYNESRRIFVSKFGILSIIFHFCQFFSVLSLIGARESTMYSVTRSFGLKGLNGFAVAVEADVSGGLPAFPS